MRRFISGACERSATTMRRTTTPVCIAPWCAPATTAAMPSRRESPRSLWSVGAQRIST